MKSRYKAVISIVVGILLLTTGLSLAQDEGKITMDQWRNKVNDQWNKDKANSELIDIGANGIIDYEKGYIEALGWSAANPRFANNPGQARLMCLRGAEVVAYRSILETTFGVQVSSETIVKDMLTESDMIKVSSQGFLRGVQKVPNSEEYFSDLSCAVKVRMPITRAVQAIGEITKKQNNIQKELDKRASILPPKIKPVSADQAGSAVYTGLVVDARGLHARPAMSPKILDESGAEVYGSMVVSKEYAVQQGVSGYARDLTAAQGNNRVTSNPVTVKGLSAEGTGKSDIKISTDDASKLRSVKENIDFMKKCRVMIVLD